MSKNESSTDLEEMRESFLSKSRQSDGMPLDSDLTSDFGALDLTKETRTAIHDESKRNLLREKMNKRTDMRCHVCSSPFFSVYTEWLSVHKYSGAKCSKLALKFFRESVSAKSFTNHKKNHMEQPFLIRRLMIAADPDVNPRKVIDATIQILHQQLVETERPDPDLLKRLKDFLEIRGDYTGETRKTPEKAVQINTWNIGTGGQMPMSSDAQESLDSPLTDEEKKQLTGLGILLEDTGSSKIRKQIPEKIPQVTRKHEDVQDVEFEED